MDTSRYKFINDALTGTGCFRPVITFDSEGRPIFVSPNTALVRYPRESEEKFARRNQVAWYENHLLSSCRRFVGYLAKKPPLRQINNPLLDQVAEDCDWRGNDADIFWQSFMIDAKARGCMLLLIDMPRDTPDSLADQAERRLLPYFVPIKPEEVKHFELNEQGKLESITINAVIDGETVIKGWDTLHWWIEKDGVEVDGDQHGLGVCPVIAFTESGDFPYVGDFAQIADMSRRLYNARSELDEILRSQTFSLLHYQVPPTQTDFNARTVAETIGASNMLIYQGSAPGFIAPDPGPAETYIATIGKLEEAIKRVALVVEAPETTAAESGVALAIRFQALNSALIEFARRMEDFERHAWSVVCRWLDLPPERVDVQWSRDFAISDIKLELEILGAMQAGGFPDAAIKQQQKQVASLLFATADPDVANEIMTAIDESTFEMPAQQQSPQTQQQPQQNDKQQPPA